MYNSAEWLHGCNGKHTFFCQYCLVMNVSDYVDCKWNSDLKHMFEIIKKHKSSEKRMNMYRIISSEQLA